MMVLGAYDRTGPGPAPQHDGRQAANREHEGMRKALALVLLAFVAFGLLLSTGCFETTAQNVQEIKDWVDVTCLDGDQYLKEVR